MFHLSDSILCFYIYLHIVFSYLPAGPRGNTAKAVDCDLETEQCDASTQEPGAEPGGFYSHPEGLRQVSARPNYRGTHHGLQDQYAPRAQLTCTLMAL